MWKRLLTEHHFGNSRFEIRIRLKCCSQQYSARALAIFNTYAASRRRNSSQIPAGRCRGPARCPAEEGSPERGAAGACAPRSRSRRSQGNAPGSVSTISLRPGDISAPPARSQRPWACVETAASAGLVPVGAAAPPCCFPEVSGSWGASGSFFPGHFKPVLGPRRRVESSGASLHTSNVMLRSVWKEMRSKSIISK